MVDPGVHKTVLGDGLATMLAGAMGGPSNTTYGENTAVLAITKNYNPRNIFIAACMAVFFGSFTIFGTAIATIPAAVIGGASIVLFGMIAASGLRALVDGKVDFSDSKNLIIPKTKKDEGEPSQIMSSTTVDSQAVKEKKQAK
jgi:uracil permease